MKNKHLERNQAQDISHSPVTATVSVAEALKTVGILVSLKKNFIQCVSCFAPPNQILIFACF